MYEYVALHLMSATKRLHRDFLPSPQEGRAKTADLASDGTALAEIRSCRWDSREGEVWAGRPEGGRKGAGGGPEGGPEGGWPQRRQRRWAARRPCRELRSFREVGRFAFGRRDDSAGSGPRKI